MQMCFECENRNIMLNKGEIECHCKADGRWHNPYRPMVLLNKECPNYKEKEDNDGEKRT